MKTAQKILIDKKLRETAYLCVEIMKSKRQVKGKLGHVVTWYKSEFDVKVMLNRSNIYHGVFFRRFGL